ncbi:MAG: hypothetical protein QOH04_2599 [Sphingomonadales bacterium]|nr:hypothetical protein [Sphingomonadales bacterium]
MAFPTLNWSRFTALVTGTMGDVAAPVSASNPLPVSAAWAAGESAQIGATNETAPATDTASSGLNGRLQRVAQRLTSLIALLPAALGSAAAASSLAVTASTEDVARTGAVAETAPASDTASSGLNGRLQRVAQRLTTLINGATATTRLLSAAASDNATLVKNAAGTLAQISGYNDSVSARWLKLYDKASAPASTDTPRKTHYLPPKSAFVLDNVGYFATGIGFRITTGSADNDTGALTAADILGLNVDVL